MFTASVTLRGVTRTIDGPSVDIVQQQVTTRIRKSGYKIASWIVVLTIIGIVTLGLVEVKHDMLMACAWITVASFVNGLVFRPHTQMDLIDAWKKAPVVASSMRVDTLLLTTS
jgi:hypothetical protein